ncbi:MAG: hypothetical protein KKF62_13100 [Bacteroidetes bacterium]|nr:hypothetical protein [Bacteroidota bacterium]MBU1114907.1 hypothetical protein [Bacteroidota bacterium]MBU1799383.1 hypothetical protein [Bacteroidota bacterium]
MDNIKRYKWILFLACCLLVVLIPIKITNNISAYAKILPSKEFVVIKGSNGQIITHLINNYSGIVEEIKTIQVDREDFASLNLKTKSSNISKGDTVAVFTSSHTNLIIEEAKGEIYIQEKLLDAQLSGEKSSVITEQEKIYEISKINYTNQETIFNRAAALYKSGLISVEEYDLAKNLLAKLKLDEEKEFQNLLSLKSGLKQEEISVTKGRIDILNNEKKILEDRASSYNLISPFNGFVFGSNSIDTLFSISETGSYVALIPIQFEKSSSINVNQKVTFLNLDSLNSITIQAQDSQIKLINGMKYVIYKSQFQIDKKLVNNIYECSIIGEDTTILEVIIKKINSIFKIS